MTPEQLTQTEDKIKDLWEAGELPSLIHLCGSKDGAYEQWLCELFEHIRPTDWILVSHRAHFHYLLAGHTPEQLIDRIKDGKSMYLYGPRFIQSAIVAGCASIAAGIGLSIQRRNGSEMVWCFQGDGAADHCHFWSAVRFVHAKQLPVKFIVENNNSSCGVTQEQRGSAIDLPLPPCVLEYKYTPKWPHAGSNTRPNLKWKP